MEQCFHHEKNEGLKKKGFVNGACVIRWDVPCAGTPDSVPEGFICPDAYIPISKVVRATEKMKKNRLNSKNDKNGKR